MWSRWARSLAIWAWSSAKTSRVPLSEMMKATSSAPDEG
jgi:hypothetical protein